MRERLQTTTSYTSTEILNRTADRTRYYDANFIEISKTEYRSGVKGFVVPGIDINGMREKLFNPTIIQEYPKLKRIFQQSRLFSEYITSESLQNSFFQRVFFGLLASESSFGTITTVRRENTNKGLYQITRTSFKDAPNAKYYNTLWPFDEKPARKHITDLEYAAHLCVLNFDRIYEITRPLLKNFSESDKAELILPILIIAYNQGGGAANRILKQLIEYKKTHNRFPSRTQMLKNALSSNYYQPGHLTYFFKIWAYSNDLRSQEARVAAQAEGYIESTSQRVALREEVRSNFTENQRVQTQESEEDTQDIIIEGEEEKETVTLEQLFATDLPQPEDESERELITLEDLFEDISPTPESSDELTKEEQINRMLRDLNQIETRLNEIEVAINTLNANQSSPSENQEVIEQIQQPRWRQFLEKRNYTHDEMVNFIVNTFEPTRETEGNKYTDRYPFDISISGYIDSENAILISSKDSRTLIERVMQTPIDRYPRKDRTEITQILNINRGRR